MVKIPVTSRFQINKDNQYLQIIFNLITSVLQQIFIKNSTLCSP